MYQSEWNNMLMVLGGTINYNSSGARLSYADYSGKFNFDQITKRLAVGTNIRIMTISEHKLTYGLEANLQISFSTLELESNLMINNLSAQKENLKFNSLSGQLRLSWINKYNILNDFYLINRIGYELDILSSKLFFKENKEAYLLTPNGKEARLDWSGIRLSMGVGINF
jgi:hypothetical protein